MEMSSAAPCAVGSSHGRHPQGANESVRECMRAAAQEELESLCAMAATLLWVRKVPLLEDADGEDEG